MNHQTQKSSGKKQPKQRRSLKKCFPDKAHQDTPEGLVLDMDKGELENIFLGLSTGQLENPQVALSRLYGLALDSLAKTVIDSLDKACEHITTNDTAHEIAGGTPFEPMLKRILPSDPQKIDAFKTSLSQKINKAKGHITDAYDTIAKEGTDRLSEQSRQSGAEIERLLREASGEGQNSHVAHPLDPERLSQIYDQIQAPVFENGPRKYTISSLPNAWRFSLGNSKTSVSSNAPGNVTVSTTIDAAGAPEEAPQSSAPTSALPPSPADITARDADITARDADTHEQPATPESTAEKASAHESDAHPGSVTAAEDAAHANAENTDTADKRLFKTSDLPIPQKIDPKDLVGLLPDMNPQVVNALADGAMDVFGMATQVTTTLEAIALEVAHAAMKAYQEDEALKRSLPSLAQRLREASDLPEDDELLDFVQTLEATDASDDSDALSNDELADAFGQLLAQLDLES